MKKLLVLILILSLSVTGAHAEDSPRMILLDVYRQMGWGDRVEIGCIDEDGNLWFMTGSASALGWPHGIEAQLDYLLSTKLLEWKYRLKASDLFDLKSLIGSTAPQIGEAQMAACDAGTQAGYAIRYGEDGRAQAILLGTSGDEVFENKDPNAQSLYLYLKHLFPEVTCYGGSMGPEGFQPVSVATFLGLDNSVLGAAKIKAYLIDCEEGPIELETLDMNLLHLALNGSVLGKANATAVTGNVTSLVFCDADDKRLCSTEFFDGLLVADDGMYFVQ